MNGQHIPNGQRAHSNGGPAPAPGAGGVRLPTVNEALPYTPFSSIIPFSPDVIPPPVVLQTTSPSVFDTYPGVASAKQMLAQLSAGATNAENASKRCKQTLCDVRKLLDPDNLTHFIFKKPKRSYTSDSGAPNDTWKPSLSPFANMVLETNDVAFRYLTPDSPEPRIKPEANGSDIEARVVLPTPQSRLRPAEPQRNGYVTPHVPEPPGGSQSFRLQAVVVPKSITSAQRAEYQYMSEGDSLGVAENATPSRRHDSSLANGYRSVGVDQKQKGDIAVQSLQSLLIEVFEAEDQLQPDASEDTATHANTFFTARDTGDGSVPALQHDVQAKLESLVQKVIANGRLESLETESLAHVQRLCESAVAAVDANNLQIGEEWSEEDANEWVLRVKVAERGLIAARTLMRVMGAGAHLKELQSEDFLRAILSALTTVTETCIVPLVEERLPFHEKIRGLKDESLPNPKFVMASAHRKPLQMLLHAATKSFRVFGDFLTKTDIDESTLSSVEYLCKVLVFAENASNEQNSIFGIQNFETTRRCAMDVVAKMFAKYTEQRQFVLDDILMSLEKLPGSKQSARHFRLVDAKPIQLVSALLMRLVQTSATRGGESIQAHSKGLDADEEDGVADSEDSADEEEDDEDDNIKVSPQKSGVQPKDLISIAKPLHDAAQQNASYIVKILLQRALSTSKSSDEPHRKLLDIFTEDFLNVVGSSDWPSAEMLLRTLVLHMIGMIESPKSAVPSRTLALELLGTIGSGILEIQMVARNAVRSLESTNTGVEKRLGEFVEQLDNGEVETNSVVGFDGPYRMVIEGLQARGLNDAQLRSAQGYHLMQWAFYVCGGREGSTDSDSSDAPSSRKDLQRKLRSMIVDLHWLEEHYEYPSMTTAHGRLAAIVVTLSSKFCKAFNRIFSILLTSLSSEHPTVKSRSLKSVVTLLEKDPSILDRNTHVLNHIFRCANDPSPLVRDSALKLIADCTRLRPVLDKTVYERVVARTRDAAVGVRKRAMKQLKDIYLRNQTVKLRSAIADAIIARMEDSEESVTELARQTMEEIWFLPFQNLKLDGDHALEAKLRYGAQAALLIRTIEANETIGKVLETLIKELLTQSKAAATHFAICKTLVRVLFDGIIDSSDIPGDPQQPPILRCLAVFAKASAKLFTAAQLERLEPYTQNLTRDDDLEVYRSTITILRHVMPSQSMLKPDFLQKLQTSLLQSVAKLPKSTLSEVVPCLWTIDGMLGNTERLVKFLISVLKNLYNMRTIDFMAEPQAVIKASKLMVIAGQFGKACDLDNHVATFKNELSAYKGNTVPGLIVEVLCPFTSPKQSMAIRDVSLEAVCMVSQSWPKNFLRADVVNAFETVFNDRKASLEEVLLSGLEGFFCANETSSVGGVPELGSGIASGTERLGRTYVATDNDGASTSIAQRFMPQILRLALNSCDEIAWVAAKLIVSINRQGLVHPKESGPALVALETCPSSVIANLAFVEHKAMHTKHESLFDKEYMRAVQQAFEYQKATIGNTAGFTGHPPVSKMNLLWEVLKTGKAQVRKKFLTNICQKLDFNLNTLDITGATPVQLEFARFCAENLAFFEYDRVEEVLHLLTAMEKIFAGTGTTVAQAIESEVLRLRVDTQAGSEHPADGTSEMLGPDLPANSLDSDRFLQLAVSAQICSLIWETRTFLLRLWNMQKHMNKSKNAAKESNRAPTRATNAPVLAEAYLKRVNGIISADATQETQHAICSSFVELISIDSDVKVVSDDDEKADLENGYDTPSEGASNQSASVPPSGGGRGRKRKSMGNNSTPRKKGRPSTGRRNSGSAKITEDDCEDGRWE